MRNHKEVYCFISDENKKFHRATQNPNGTYTITKNSMPYPIDHNPANITNFPIEFATNVKYFSMNRSVATSLEFIKDGAAILRALYHLGKGTQQNCYLTIVQWNGTRGLYELAYYGRFDMSEKTEEPKLGKFTVPVVDDSAWGILSQKDAVTYAIDCNEYNPKAIKVLFDSITLVNKYTFQTVQAPVTQPSSGQQIAGIVIPFVLINQDGDSSGITTKNQTLYNITYPNPGTPTFDALADSPSWFFNTAYAITGVHVYGTFMFEYNNSQPLLPGSGINLWLYTSKLSRTKIYGSGGGLTLGKIYTVNFDFTIDMAVSESLFLVLEFGDPGAGPGHVTITPIVSNIFIGTITYAEPAIVYGLRPLDLLQQIVFKATDGRFGINSEFFTINNKSICFAGDSIRGFANAKLYTSLADFFITFDAINFMAFRIVNGEVWMEKVIEVYKQSGIIIDLGEAIDVKLNAASEHEVNEIEIGSPDQDYRHPSGRLEVNSTDTFSLPMLNTNKKASIVTKYRLGCYDIQFMILDYRGASTQDNSGDKSVYVAEITDELGTALEDIQTFENINIDNAILEPIIKSPLNNTTIANLTPRIKGIAPPLSNVNVYIDTVLDGNTVADVDGNWSYVTSALSTYSAGVETGIHLIEVTYTDLAAPTSSISILVDTSLAPIPTEIVYPAQQDSLYNNKPLIKGAAQAGSDVDITMDGTLIATVTADESGFWEYKSGVIPNGSHTIVVTGGDSSTFVVDTNVAHPLITYVGSELDGFVILNNLPLIEGVAMPGTVVDLFLNYITYAKLGTATADANGNWSFQVIPVTYNDPVTGAPVVLAPIQNGLNIISTSLINYTVGIAVSGYKLNRPAFDSITGVTDNTIYNTSYSPKRMLLNRNPLWASVLAKQPNEKIYYQKSLKNGNMKTTIGGVTIAESDDVPASSLGTPLAILENGLIKTKTEKTFANILYDFNNGGIIKTTFRGTPLYFLPIGGMKMNNITSEVQEWKLLMSPLTSYTSLLGLYRNGLILNLMKNAIYHSDYNSLHFVQYNTQLENQYNHYSIYEERFDERNTAWLYNPDYTQKFQKDEVIVDQLITNGVTTAVLKVYNCKTGLLIDAIAYVPISPAPIPAPEVVLNVPIDFSDYAAYEHIYFVISILGVPIAISERIWLKSKWEGTILIDSRNSINKTGAFFVDGFSTKIRVEGLIKKLQPDIMSTTATSETGDKELLYSVFAKKRVVRFGTAYGLPDYLYLKIAAALTFDELTIEREEYVLPDDEKISPSEDIDGHPLYYYNVNLSLRDNSQGAVFLGAPETGGRTGVVLVVDATAFGLPANSLINIEVDNG